MHFFKKRFILERVQDLHRGNPIDLSIIIAKNWN